MTYTIEEILYAANQEIDAWKRDGEERRTDADYARLGFVHAVIRRLGKSKPPTRQEFKDEVIRFSEWMTEYGEEYDFREQKTHSTEELYEIFKQR